MKYDLYGEFSGYIESFDTLEEIQEYIKELKKFDKRNGIEEEYYIEANDEGA